MASVAVTDGSVLFQGRYQEGAGSAAGVELKGHSEQTGFLCRDRGEQKLRHW